LDKQIKKVIDETNEKFGLENYTLERYAIYKERDYNRKAYYKLNMEWFPNELPEPIEEDMNPDGTAVIEYHIQKEQFTSVTFVQGMSFSTLTHFPNKTTEEVTVWVENEIGYEYGKDFKLVEDQVNRKLYGADVDGIQLSPTYSVEVEFDGEGKLTSYFTYGVIPLDEMIERTSFSLTLEEIEPFVKKQLQLFHFSTDAENRFIPLYAMEEVFVTVQNAKPIAFIEDERTLVKIAEVMDWEEPIKGELNKEEMSFLCIATAEDAFNDIDVNVLLLLTDEQINQSKIVVRDAFRTEYPAESGLWMLESLQYRKHFIEAHCRRIDDEMAPIKRKVVIFIQPENMKLLNLMDNAAIFELFESFERVGEVAVTHEEAFEIMLPYISLDPAYVYDETVDKFVLSGLLGSSEGVDAVTGEVISLLEL